MFEVRAQRQHLGDGLDTGEGTDHKPGEAGRIDIRLEVTLLHGAPRQVLARVDPVQIGVGGTLVVDTEFESDPNAGPHDRVVHDLPGHLVAEHDNLLDRRRLFATDRLHRSD